MELHESLIACSRKDLGVRLAETCKIDTYLINYTLSTKADPSLVHPCHVESCADALRRLVKEQKAIKKLVLIGHSAGAHLASLLVLDSTFADLRPFILGVVGVQGIYDIPLLVATFGHIPMYQEFVRMAFSNDEQVWRDASPINMRGSDSLPAFIIIHSLEDTLVDPQQAKSFHAHIVSCLSNPSSSNPRLPILRLDIGGSHDGIMHSQELATAIAEFTLPLLINT
ncbi:MAG: hypothetical protein SGCHY_004777 [Lobulomycetales sp.]